MTENTVLPSIILLHGSDEIAISRHIKKIEAGLGDSSTAEMNITHFDGSAGLDLEAFNTAVNAAAFLAPYRVVVLEHPLFAFNSPSTRTRSKGGQERSQGAPSEGTSDDLMEEGPGAINRKKFLDLLDKAQPTTNIILAEYEALKSDHWLMKWAVKARPRASVQLYSMPKAFEMPGWIEKEVKKQGGVISGEAATRLSEMVGVDSYIAAQEVKKLLTYVNFDRPITLQDVERVSIVSAQGSIFNLVDAIGGRQGGKAQHLLHQLLEDEDAFALWGMVIRQFRLLLQVRDMQDSKASLPEISTALGMMEFVAKKVYDQAKHFSLAELETIYHKLLEIDVGNKSGQLTLEVALDSLIVELTEK